MNNRRSGALGTLVGLLLTITLPVGAQNYDPVHGGELLNQLRSPLFLTTTENTASTEAISGDVVNPATSALKQRVHLDTSYIGIVGDGSLSGHAANLGVSVPTPVGVFTGSGNYAQADYDAMNLGQRGSVNFSFAKDLYPSLLFGAGVQSHFGGNGGSSGFGVGLDLGIIHILGPVAGLPELRWGAAVTNMGLPYAPQRGRTGSPAPFTPAADIQALLVDSEDVDWTVHTGFSAPSFQNVRYRVGSRVSFFDRVTLNLGWDVDLVEQTDGDRDAGSLLPSVGISVRFQTDIRDDDGVITDRGWNRSDIDVHTAWAPLYDDVWAAGAGVHAALGVIDRTPPEVEVEYEETRYLSPNNDGASDELLLPVSITDERYVTSWSLEVTDPSGTVVRRIENKEQRPENVGFRNIVDRLLYVKKGVAIPDEIRWDGRTDDGGVAPDGTYQFTVTAVDDNGNTNVIDSQPIVIDATPPDAAFTEPEEEDALIFSPNDDGRKDTITLDMETSPEDRWTIEVLDGDDTAVYSEEVTDSAVSQFSWDGTNDAGTLVPDGVYSFRATATDRALNTTTTRINNIILDTEPTPINLAIDIAYFSPNGDGRRDSVVLTPEIPVTEGIRSHTVVLRDATGTIVRTIEGGESIPPRWTFDGRDDVGRRLPEGRYTAELTITYRNGNRPAATAPPVVLDVTAPEISVRADTDVFSPNGDGNLDTVRFVHSADAVPEWNGTIEAIADSATAPEATDTAASDEAAVRSFRWTDLPPATVEWDGRNEAGSNVPDGRYRYTLVGEDRAGNIGRSTPIIVQLDTRETPVFVFPSRVETVSTSDTPPSTRGGVEAFSPNGDGVQDTIFLVSELTDPRGAQRFELAILDERDEVVARVNGTGAPEERYPWDGRDRNGRIAADGTYRARLEVAYRHGNRPHAVSAPFIIDTQRPRVTVNLDEEARVFSPDGDNDKDTIQIEQSSSDESTWTARIVRTRDNTPVRTWRLSGVLGPRTWDGTDDDGEVVPDGVYRYEVEGIDEAGNRTVARTATITTDTREIEIGLRASEDAFSPNNDGVLDSVVFSPQVAIDLSVASWELAVFPVTDGPDNPVYTAQGGGELADVTWDGRDDSGAPLPDGEYRALITAELFQREEPATAITAREVTLDTQAPTAEVTLSSEIISPNGDGRLDELVIMQDTSEEERWIATVEDESGREVGRWEWVGTAPQELRFAGLTTARRRVEDGVYTYRINATDRAGNRGGSGSLPFEVYTVETPLRFYTQRLAFSPNNDGTLDDVTFGAEIAAVDDIERWELRIERTDAGADDVSPVSVRSGTAQTLPETFGWDGRTDQRTVADEGAYRAVLEIDYRHGNVASATTEAFDLDVTPPAISVVSDETIFSPDGDGDRDAITIVQESDPAESWNAAIINEDGETVRRFEWNERVTNVEWNGADGPGNVLPDGVYTYRVEGRDRAGNESTAALTDLTIDTRPVRLYITLNTRRFSPNNDGIADELNVGLITSRTDGALSYRAEIVDDEGRVVRTFPIEAITSRTGITWDGRNDDGEVVDGRYTVRYRGRYDNGAQPMTQSPVVTVDTTGPRLAVNLDGLPFSPDNDGLNDELRIGLATIDATGIDSWSFDILDRSDRPFFRFEGSGEPRSRLIWDGRSSEGETVISAEDYPYRFIAVDPVGNRSEVRGTIPIDILVIRDGNLLKIQISNINFEPNSPVLELDETTPEGRKNVSVLDRLVEVFDKYQSYEIRVEGHAVNVTQTDREEREELQPLSLARAEAVRDALIERGMSGGRISTVGRGGTDPIVPHTDLDDRWKNRRVEFILIR